MNPDFPLHVSHNQIKQMSGILMLHYKSSSVQKKLQYVRLFPEFEAPWTAASFESAPKYKIGVILIEKLIKFLKTSAVVPARQPRIRLSGDRLHIVADGWGTSLCYTGMLGHRKYRL